jgi:hypothetical protein
MQNCARVFGLFWFGCGSLAGTPGVIGLIVGVGQRIGDCTLIRGIEDVTPLAGLGDDFFVEAERRMKNHANFGNFHSSCDEPGVNKRRLHGKLLLASAALAAPSLMKVVTGLVMQVQV